MQPPRALMNIQEGLCFLVQCETRRQGLARQLGMGRSCRAVTYPGGARGSGVARRWCWGGGAGHPVWIRQAIWQSGAIARHSGPPLTTPLLLMFFLTLCRTGQISRGVN